MWFPGHRHSHCRTLAKPTHSSHACCACKKNCGLHINSVSLVSKPHRYESLSSQPPFILKQRTGANISSRLSAAASGILLKNDCSCTSRKLVSCYLFCRRSHLKPPDIGLFSFIDDNFTKKASNYNNYLMN